MTNSILNAFIEQTYGSLEKAKEADKQAEQKVIAEKELAKNFHQKAMLEMAKNQNIKSSMAIPTKLKDGELNQKTIPHKNFANYDHSLEIDRTGVIRQKYLDEKYKDNPNDKPSLEDFKELEAGSVEEMTNNMFKD